MCGVYLRETDGKHTKVSLQACVDGEATSSRVHRGNVLDILYVFQSLLLAVIPVIVIQMLENIYIYMNKG